ncbi:hypothetical protein Poly30_03000 [Planctomycetes bacterium Poly30]|uniref:Carbohydrate binding module (Family 6) n=1 Tax=Saltatorellus ferox TaxID=2528018 RepID=A0A518EL38_9BACT|nr:hypothetical protein Poly30_03000 [Planctomycetes bacterium Poly30]
MKDTFFLTVLALVSCAGPVPIGHVAPPGIDVVFGGNTASSNETFATTCGAVLVLPDEDTGERWVEFDVSIPSSGTYRMEIVNVFAVGTLWVEDLTGPASSSPHGITGPIEVDHTIGISGSVEPPYSPARDVILKAGAHRMRLNADAPEFLVYGVRFSAE